MDESEALIQAILREEGEQSYYKINDDNDDNWQTVSYKKRGKKLAKPSEIFQNSDSWGVFPSIGEQNLRPDTQWAPTEGEWGAEAEWGDVVEDVKVEVQPHENEEGGTESAVVEKKVKQKKPKKPKVTVAEAAAKIDPSDLAAFLADRTEQYEFVDVAEDSKEEREKQLNLVMGIADYFGRAFAAVSASQFPWLKMLNESSVAKMEDIPLSHISEDVYQTSADWLKGRSFDALKDLVLWALDSILAELSIHQKVEKGNKKVVQQAPSRSQVAIFVVLAITLRRKPDLVISILPSIKEDVKYQGQDKLPIMMWMITQASQGDLVVGVYMWTHFLLPLLARKSSCSPQSRDLILQFAERALSAPKARSILLNGAVKKGERLVPPSALDLLMRSAFPAPSSSRVKETERLKSVYPTLKEIALAGSPGSKAMKQITQEILQLALKAAGEGVRDLSLEANSISLWCLSQNPDCYKQLDMLYLDNLEASVVLLRKLASEWNEQSVKHPNLEPLKATLKSLGEKNEKGLRVDDDVTRRAHFKEAEKQCKALCGKLSKSNGCIKSMVIVSVALVVGAAAAFMSTDSGLKKVFLDFNF